MYEIAYPRLRFIALPTGSFLVTTPTRDTGHIEQLGVVKTFEVEAIVRLLQHRVNDYTIGATNI